MYFPFISKLKNIREKRFPTLLLVIIFTLMAGFSPAFHNHEFDLDGPHQDCSPCQFAQINADVNDFFSEIFSSSVVQTYKTSLTSVHLYKFSWTFSGLSPPSFI